jgi:hypothetical protein
MNLSSFSQCPICKNSDQFIIYGEYVQCMMRSTHFYCDKIGTIFYLNEYKIVHYFNNNDIHIFFRHEPILYDLQADIDYENLDSFLQIIEIYAFYS